MDTVKLGSAPHDMSNLSVVEAEWIEREVSLLQSAITVPFTPHLYVSGGSLYLQMVYQ